MSKIKVLQFGLGAMGSMMARIALEKEGLELVGAIDRDPEKLGKDLGSVLALKKNTGVKVYNNIEDALKKVKPDVMVHAAVSYVPKVWEQIKPAVRRGISVITIAEEMGYPFVKYPGLCKEMDSAAKKSGARILGSGINPGFAMDILPLLISGVCWNVDSIRVIRLIDFSPFGPAIQKNIGIGMSVADFKAGVSSGKMPLHIGLPECCYMLAKALGWKIDKVVETRVPVTAGKAFNVPGYMRIEKGKVAGFDHKSFAYVKGKKKIILEELGRVEKGLDYRNTIIIDGKPKIVETMNVPPGNITTTSHAVNLIPALLKTEPGLHCMLDIPIASAIKVK
jgi:4-hydroxy-tetrahydrodipicolinate reductase